MSESDGPKRGPGILPAALLAAVLCVLVFWWPLLSWLGWI